jgi:hypothetical protein
MHILHSKQMKLTLWGEELFFATHIINQMLAPIVQVMNPYEKWYGKKPSLSHFRVFKSSAWAHTPNGKQA